MYNCKLESGILIVPELSGQYQEQEWYEEEKKRRINVSKKTIVYIGTVATKINLLYYGKTCIRKEDTELHLSACDIEQGTRIVHQDAIALSTTGSMRLCMLTACSNCELGECLPYRVLDRDCFFRRSRKIDENRYSKKYAASGT